MASRTARISLLVAAIFLGFTLYAEPVAAQCLTVGRSPCRNVVPGCCPPDLTCYATAGIPDGTCVSSTPPPGPPAGTITLINPLSGTSDLRGLIERFVTILRDFATPIAILMILFGAFRILTAAGDPAKFETGKKILLYTAIGYAIIFVGWGITSIIESLLSS